MTTGSILCIGVALGISWTGVAVSAAEDGRGDTLSPAVSFRRAFASGWTLWSDTLARALSKYEMPWEPFIGLSELLLRTPMLTLFHTGEAAGWHQLGFGRVSLHRVGQNIGGRPWQELTVGVVPLEFYPPEWIEAIELLRGTEAAVFGWGALGVALNLVEPVWQTGAIYSRLWYLNAAYGVGGSSGVLSLSPQSAWEVSGGYRRLSSEGRFRNGWSNGWNVWGRVQWTPSDQLAVRVSELFTEWVTGLNGGIDVQSTPAWWDELNARPVWEEFDARCYRHDVTLTAVWRLDSARLFSGQVWYAPVLWQYHVGEALRRSLESPEHFQWRSWQGGIRFHGELRQRSGLWAGGLALLGGGGAETPLAPTVQQESAVGYLFHRFAVGGARAWFGGRLLIEGGRIYSGGGVGACGVLHGAEWWADLSRSIRVRQTGRGRHEEELIQVWGEMLWRGQRWRAGMGVIGQWFDSAVIAMAEPQPSHPSTPQQALLGWITLRLNVPHFPQGWVELTATALPLAETSWRQTRVVVALGGEWKLGGGEVRGDIRWEIVRAPALRLSPLRWELQDIEAAERFRHSGGEVRLAARLGAAYVRMSIRNVLNVAWYRMPWYPQPGRSVVFVLTWSFAD